MPSSKSVPFSLAVIAFALSLFVIACSATSPAATGSIELVLLPPGDDRSAPLTLIPDFSLEIEQYSISGTGPGGASFELTTGDAGENSVTSVVLGAWTLSAVGTNSEGTCIVQGEVTVEVAGEGTTATIPMHFEAGTGTLVFSVNVVENSAQGQTLSVTAGRADGETLTLDVISPETGLFTGTATMDAGVYLLKVTLFAEEEVRVAGAVASAFVLRESTTTGAFDLYAPPPPLGPLTITPDSSLCSPMPTTLSISPGSPFFVGNTLSVVCNIDSAVAPLNSYTTTWYVDGVKQSAVGDLLTTTFAPPGIFRIDAVVSTGETPVASASSIISIIDPVLYGPFAYLETLYDNIAGVDGLSGARDCTIHPSGKTLFVAGYDEAAIAVFQIDAESLRPLFHTRVSDSDAVPLTKVCALALSPDGNFLAAATSSSHIELYSLDGDGLPDGTSFPLPPSLDNTTPIEGIRDLCFSPDNTSLFAVAHDDTLNADYLLTYLRSTGSPPFEPASVLPLSEIGTFPDTLDPAAVTISPSGKWIAVSGKTSDSVALFAVDTSTGEISEAALFSDGVGGVDGLNGGGGMTFSPDGSWLYAVGYYDSAVAVFHLTNSIGWEIAGCLRNGENGIAGLHYPRDLSISADGQWLFVAASGDDSLCIFERNPQDGSLLFAASAINGTGRVAGIDGARSVAIHPTDGAVYLASSNDDSLALFTRRE